MPGLGVDTDPPGHSDTATGQTGIPPLPRHRNGADTTPARALASAHGIPSHHADRAGPRRRPRGRYLEPRSRAVARRRDHQARARGIPHRGRRSLHRGERASAGVARALSRGRGRRGVLLEEPAEGRAGFRRGGDGDVQQRAAASAAVPRRDRLGRVGGADEHDRVPSVGFARHRPRPPRRAAHRPRPAAGHRHRRGGDGRARTAGRAARGGSRTVDQDQRQPRPARVLPDRTDARVPRRTARRHRRGARARETDAGCRDHQLVEGGARESASSSTSTRRTATARWRAPTRRAHCPRRRCRRR